MAHGGAALKFAPLMRHRNSPMAHIILALVEIE
jgi:hypothetical protein